MNAVVSVQSLVSFSPFLLDRSGKKMGFLSLDHFWVPLHLRPPIMAFGSFLIYTGKNIPAGYFALFGPLVYQGASFFYKKSTTQKELRNKEHQIKHPIPHEEK
jgi:hypothetical protein